MNNTMIDLKKMATGVIVGIRPCLMWQAGWHVVPADTFTRPAVAGWQMGTSRVRAGLESQTSLDADEQTVLAWLRRDARAETRRWSDASTTLWQLRAAMHVYGSSKAEIDEYSAITAWIDNLEDLTVRVETRQTALTTRGAVQAERLAGRLAADQRTIALSDLLGDLSEMPTSTPRVELSAADRVLITPAERRSLHRFLGYPDELV